MFQSELAVSRKSAMPNFGIFGLALYLVLHVVATPFCISNACLAWPFQVLASCVQGRCTLLLTPLNYPPMNFLHSIVITLILSDSLFCSVLKFLHVRGAME